MNKNSVRPRTLLLLVSSLSGCATVGRVTYSSPTVSPAEGVRHLEPRESAVAVDGTGGVSVRVDFLNGSSKGLTGLLVPIFPFASQDMGSEDLLHVTVSVARARELLLVDPSAITLSVGEGPPMRPVCALKSRFWRREGGRAYTYVGPREMSGRCERGLLAHRRSSFETGASTDSVAANDVRSYDLFYPVRFDEPRPLLLRIDGIRSGNGVLALPTLRYERTTRWRSAFGAPFQIAREGRSIGRTACLSAERSRSLVVQKLNLSSMARRSTLGTCRATVSSAP